MPKMFTANSATFCKSIEALASSQPSMIQAIEATTKTPKPTTMVFGDQLEATMHAATIVRTAAAARSMESASKS